MLTESNSKSRNVSNSNFHPRPTQLETGQNINKTHQPSLQNHNQQENLL